MRGLSAATLLLAGALLAGPLPSAALAPGPVTVRTNGDVTILADRIEEVASDNLLVATGNVEVSRGTARLLADRVELNRDTGDVVAQGRVIFYDGDDQLTGERIEYNVRTGTGVIYRGRILVAPAYRIAGERLERVGESVYHVRRGIFTTCEDDGSPAWSFRFGSATADLEDLIYGTNASFWAKGVPLIPFFPFFAARTSTACPPTAGSDSTKTHSSGGRRSGPSPTCPSRGRCRTGTAWAASSSTRTSRRRTRSSSSGCPSCRSRACGNRSRDSPASSTRSTRAPSTSTVSSAPTARGPTCGRGCRGRSRSRGTPP